MTTGSRIPLGSKVRDTITGFEGTATARITYLHSVEQLRVESKGLFEGKPIEAQWVDEPRVELLGA